MLTLIAQTRLLTLDPLAACALLALGLYIVLQLVAVLVTGARAQWACRVVVLLGALWLLYRIVWD